MKILVTGASGLVGSALIPFLIDNEHTVVRLRRAGMPLGTDEAAWDPVTGSVDIGALDGTDAVVHLAGANIAAGRWTEQRKATILRSRAVGTRKLAETLARSQRPPRVLVASSAIGYYGDHGDETVDETSGSGTGFLAAVCRTWEEATRPATEHGIRVVSVRTGVVLSPHGGMLRKILPAARLGLGGVIGNGRQYVSWISIDDLVGAIHHGLVTDALSGPVNAVAPGPVTQREFVHTLARVLRRPALFRIPAFAARAIFGEMAEEMLLASTRVAPMRLEVSGYRFRHPDLETALRDLLDRPQRSPSKNTTR